MSGIYDTKECITNLYNKNNQTTVMLWYMGIVMGIVVTVTISPVYADWDYLDVDVDLLGFERHALCDYCITSTRTYHTSLYGDTYSRVGEVIGGAHDMLVLDIRVEAADSVIDIDLSDPRSFRLVVDYNGDKYRFVTFNQVRSTISQSDNVESWTVQQADKGFCVDRISNANDGPFVWWDEVPEDLCEPSFLCTDRYDICYSNTVTECVRADTNDLCTNMTLVENPLLDDKIRAQWVDYCKQLVGDVDIRSISDGENLRLCFPVPVSTELYSLQLWDTDYNKARQTVSLGNLDCDDSVYCTETWDLSQVDLDRTYTYAITGATFYDRVYPGYGDIVDEAVTSGLNHWKDVNPDMSFQHVNNPADVDFVVVMGGTGDGPRTDTFGSVNDIGCLVEHDTDCTIQLFVENAYGTSIELFGHSMIEYVTAHEFGHLLGMPHHGSSLHLMYSETDTNRVWYEDSEYGLTAPYIAYPAVQTIQEEVHSNIAQLKSAYDDIVNKAGDDGPTGSNWTQLQQIITTLFGLLG